MSYFSYAASVWNNMTDMLTVVAETIGGYVNTDTVETPENLNETIPPKQKDTEKIEEKDVSTEVAEKEVIPVARVQEESDAEFEIITDHDLYVVLYEHDRGIDTEENFFIDLEESTRHH